MAKSTKGRRSIGEIEPTLEKIQMALLRAGIVFEVCGSIRRKHVMIGDIDMVVSRSISETLTAIDYLEPVVIANGTAKAEVIVDGIHVDFISSNPAEWGAAVCYLTGSKSFNIKLRGLAKRRGYKLNQRGLFDANGNCVASMVERDIFNVLATPYVEPTERDDASRLD